jgi:hypothetical protein
MSSMFVLACLCAVSIASAPATFTINAAQHTPISPYIYGVNHPDWDGLGPGITIARLGGNRMTAYNWETNASNAGADYRHQNDGYLGSSDEPGWTCRTFLEAAQRHGAAVILTVPTAGYVSADKRGDGDVNQTPDYLNARFHRSLARKPAARVFPPDTKDRAVYQDEFVAWIWRLKSPETPLWFNLDNEPDLWAHTHARICPKQPTYAEIIANNVEYASAIKDAAPGAVVIGPANYGWQGFRRFQDASDAAGRDFLDVYLAAMRDAEKRAGKRLLDVLDIHWYPEAQGDGVRICFGGDRPGTPAARIQAPRSLWDPTYTEKSWITDVIKKPIALLPGIQDQIGRHYPGTKLAITEYNYGGGRVISGAIAQADVLGTFGRYRVYAACNWGISPRDTAQVAGFRAFVNFDGKGACFGDVGLAVSGETPEANACYAALDSRDPRRLTIVAINKKDAPTDVRLVVQGFRASSAKAWTIAGGPPFAGAPSEVRVSGDAMTLTAPALSVTTILVSSR